MNIRRYALLGTALSGAFLSTAAFAQTAPAKTDGEVEAVVVSC